MFLVACYRVGVQYCECNLVLAIWLKGALQLMGSRIMQLVMGSEIKDLLSTRCGSREKIYSLDDGSICCFCCVYFPASES
jgi:hypothetical protein